MRLAVVISLAATPASAGTLKQVVEYNPPQCVEVPDNVACLSACAMAAAMADELQNNGILGWHHAYDPETMEAAGHILQFLLMTKAKHGASYSEISATTPSLFLMYGDGYNGELMEWHNLRGYDIVSIPDALREC